MIARGVLIDVAAYKGVAALTDNYRINEVDLQGALQRQGTELQAGDVVLIRTGQAQHYEQASDYLDNYAGINLEAVKWLVEEKGSMLLGADNLSFEAFRPSGKITGCRYIPIYWRRKASCLSNKCNWKPWQRMKCMNLLLSLRL